MNLDIDFLKTFIAVADTKGFTSASRLVCRSQSAVSKQIKRLESEVKKRLFERSGNSVQLTPEGNLILKYARQIVKAHDDAAAAIARPPLMETIRFGAPEHYTFDLLPKLLVEFSSSYPNTRIDLRCENSDVIKDATERGELDIGLATQFHEEGQVVFYDHLVWIAKPGFNFVEGKRLHLAVFQENCIFSTLALAAMDKADIDYHIAYTSQSVAGILDVVRTGMAIAPVIKSTVPPDLSIMGIESGLPILPVFNVALHISKSTSSPGLTCFSELLIKSFAEKCKSRLRPSSLSNENN